MRNFEQVYKPFFLEKEYLYYVKYIYKLIDRQISIKVL